VLLDVAGLARSTFFYHQAKHGQPDALAELKAAIGDAFHAAYGRYGHRRIHAVLTKQGWQVAKKTVLKLMRVLGLFCQVRRRRSYSSFKGDVGTIADNVLNRDFTATAPNQKWVTDVTEFRVADRKVYLSLIDRLVRPVGGRALLVAVTKPKVN
jgi:putative transposase